MSTPSWLVTLAIGLALAADTGSAAPATYTQHASFVAALPGSPTTHTFDNAVANASIPSGTALDGITFVYDFGGALLRVSTENDSGYSTTSSPHFLGTDDADILQDGDTISFSFGEVTSIGLYIISKDDMIDDDVTLVAGGTSVGLAAADVQATLADGSRVYFLGISDAAASFFGASLTTAGNREFLFNVDDIITVVVAGADTDGDGVPDNIDQFPLDPLRSGLDTDSDGFDNVVDPDDDNDGFDDVFELVHRGAPYFMDPLVDTGARPTDDIDGDGVSLFDEISNGSLDTSADSDGDGATDNYEISVTGTDPAVADPVNVGPLPAEGDLDQDGDVDISDLLRLEQILTQPSP